MFFDARPAILHEVRRLSPAAVLSFALPGLGQLAQKRLAFSFAFFGAFVAALSYGWWAVPLVALVSGLEALRMPRSTQTFGPAYGVVGGVALVAWVSAFFLPLLPLKMAMNEDVERIMKEVMRCVSVEKCPLTEPTRNLRDPWGRPYGVSPRGEHFEVRSSGPDGVSGTVDDAVFVGRLLSR